MLDELQPNIVKEHTREFLTILFLKFTDPAGGCTLLKSARAHLMEVKAFKAAGTKGTPYIGVGITRDGYAALQIPDPKIPQDGLFLAGMKNAALNDPAPASWDPHFHAVILVGDQMSGPRNKACGRASSDPGRPRRSDPRRGKRPRPAQQERRRHRALRLC
ncbi:MULTISPECIES: hypothetical protein [unclassified Rhizobium]|uniref:hypothetical protein n=1 Tax=unclassified Rhizobium TaxID=2613769 RepID=UPI001FDA33E0|nr:MULTISPECIES: hypothetical protein [unclassified Rhizobium]